MVMNRAEIEEDYRRMVKEIFGSEDALDDVDTTSKSPEKKPLSKKQKSKRDNVVAARKLQTLAKRLRTDAAFLDTLAQGLLRASQED